MTAAEQANRLHKHCRAHLWPTYTRRGETPVRDDLYRIFYYDCPPSEKKVYHPLLQRQIDLSTTELYTYMTEFHNQLRSMRKVALRLGLLADSQMSYTIKPDIVKKLCRGAITKDDLQECDFALNIVQKGVDIRIGIDIASMAYKKQVTKIVLISGDSDFVPAAKLARREGLDVVLDPMGATIRPELNEHVDGIRCPSTAVQNRPVPDPDDIEE